jgi:hypothetical protein
MWVRPRHEHNDKRGATTTWFGTRFDDLRMSRSSSRRVGCAGAALGTCSSRALAAFTAPEPSHTGGHERPRHELHREGREKKEERAHLDGRRGRSAAVLAETGDGARRGSSPRRGLHRRVDGKGAAGASTAALLGHVEPASIERLAGQQGRRLEARLGVGGRTTPALGTGPLRRGCAGRAGCHGRAAPGCHTAAGKLLRWVQGRENNYGGV